jgi:hypothetical protein
MEQAENGRPGRRHIHCILFHKLSNWEHVVGTVLLKFLGFKNKGQ